MPENKKINKDVAVDRHAQGQEVLGSLMSAVAANQEEAVKAFIEAGADPDYRSIGDNTALMLAAARGYTKIAEMLIVAGASVNRQNAARLTALAYAVNRGHITIVELLLANGANVDLKSKCNSTALMQAALHGHKKIAEVLIAAGSDLDIQDKVGNTALITSIIEGHKEVAEVLIEAGADIGKQEEDGWRALTWAAEKGYTKIVEKLLAVHGCNANHACHRGGDTPLVRAAYSGHDGIVKALLNHGADIEAEGWNGFTALIYAAQDGRTSTVEKLLQAGAKVNAKSKSGDTALNLAARKGHMTVMQKLLDAGAEVEAYGNGDTPLINAVNKGDLECVKLLLDRGAKVDASGNGDTPLINAVNKGDLECVELLLDRGAKTDAQSDGWTALVCAAQDGREDIVKALLDRKCKVDMQNPEGLSALAMALYNKNLSVANMLLEANADLNLYAKGGDTPLIRAAAYGHTDIAEFLIKAGAKLDLTQDKGYTALTVSILHGHEEVAKALIKAKANVNTVRKNAWSALVAAVVKNRPVIVELLLNAGSKVSEKTVRGSVFRLAVCYGHIEVVKVFLAKGAKVNTDNLSENVLVDAVKKSHTEIVQMLIAAGADVDAKNQYFDTALIYAVREGHTEIAQLLIKAKANVNVKDKNGDTALMLAAERGHLEIIKAVLLYSLPKEIQCKYKKLLKSKSIDVFSYADYINFVWSQVELSGKLDEGEINGVIQHHLNVAASEHSEKTRFIPVGCRIRPQFKLQYSKDGLIVSSNYQEVIDSYNLQIQAELKSQVNALCSAYGVSGIAIAKSGAILESEQPMFSLVAEGKNVKVNVDLIALLVERGYEVLQPIVEEQNAAIFKQLISDLSKRAAEKVIEMKKISYDQSSLLQLKPTSELSSTINKVCPALSEILSMEITFNHEIERIEGLLQEMLADIDIEVINEGAGFVAHLRYGDESSDGAAFRQLRRKLDSLRTEKTKMILNRDRSIANRILRLEKELLSADFKDQFEALHAHSTLLKKRGINAQPVQMFYDALQALKAVTSDEEEQAIAASVKTEGDKKPLTEKLHGYLTTKAKEIIVCQEKRTRIPRKLFNHMGLVARKGPEIAAVAAHISLLENDFTGLPLFTGFQELKEKFSQFGIVKGEKWIGMLNEQKNQYLKLEELASRSEILHRKSIRCQSSPSGSGKSSPSGSGKSSPVCFGSRQAAAKDTALPSWNVDGLRMSLKVAAREFSEKFQCEEKSAGLVEASRALVAHYVGMLHVLQKRSQMIKNLHDIVGHQIQFVDGEKIEKMLKAIDLPDDQSVIDALSVELEGYRSLEYEDEKAVLWESLGHDVAIEKMVNAFQLLIDPLPERMNLELYYQKRDALYSFKVLFQSKRMSEKRLTQHIARILDMSEKFVSTKIEKFIGIRNSYRHRTDDYKFLIMRTMEQDYETLKMRLTEPSVKVLSMSK